MSERRSAHLSAAEVAALVDGVVAHDARGGIDAHLCECLECRDEVVDASRIAAKLARTKRTRRLAWIPALAAAALVFVLVRPDVLREPASDHREAPVTTTVLPRGVTPVGAVDSIGPLLWTSVPHADRYQVRIFDADGSVVWEQTTSDTTAVVARVLRSGRTYYWKVEANTGFDRRAASELIEFSVRRSP